MKRTRSYIVAFLACALELFIYGCICAMLNLKKGGGFLFGIILFSILSVTWKSIVSAMNRPKKKITNTDSLNADKLCEDKDIQDGKSADLIDESQSPDSEIDSLCSDHNSTTSKDEPCTDKSEPDSDVLTEDYHPVVKGVIIVLMALSCINLFSQVITNMTWGNYSIGAIELVGGLINLFSFILIYKQKLSGVILYVGMMLLQILINLFLNSVDIESVVISCVVRLIIISLILLVRKNGVSGWSILKKNADFSCLKMKKNKELNPAIDANTSNDEKREGSPCFENHQPDSETDFEEKKEDTDGLPCHNDVSSKVAQKHPINANDEENTLPVKNKSRKISLPFYAMIAFGFILICVLVYFYRDIASQQYPDYVETLWDKTCYHYDWNNNTLNKSLIDKANNAKNNELEDLELQYMEEASSIKTNNHDAIIEMINFFYDKNDFVKVLQLSDYGIELFPDKSIFYAFCAQAYYQLNNSPEVVRLAQKAMELDPESPIASWTLMQYYYKEEDYSNTFKWAKKTSTLAPEQAYPYYVLAKCSYELGNKEEAVNYYNKGVELNPEISYSPEFDYVAGIPFVINSLEVANVTYDETIINGYGSNFYDDNTRYFNLRAKISPLRLGTVSVNIKLYHNGTLSTGSDSPVGCSYRQTVVINSKDPQTVDLGAWGSDEPGNWGTGSYRFEVWSGKQRIGMKTFNVYNAISWKYLHKNEF